MVRSSAEKFIGEIWKNSEFRRSFYKLKTPEEIRESIWEAGFKFKYYEFEDSINNLKTRCAAEEDAIMLDELLLWWQMLLPVEEKGSTGSACSPSDCALCSSCS